MPTETIGARPDAAASLAINTVIAYAEASKTKAASDKTMKELNPNVKAILETAAQDSKGYKHVAVVVFEGTESEEQVSVRLESRTEKKGCDTLEIYEKRAEGDEAKAMAQFGITLRTLMLASRIDPVKAQGLLTSGVINKAAYDFLVCEEANPCIFVRPNK